MSTLKEITSALKEKNLPEFAEKIEIISQEQDEESDEEEWSYRVRIVSTKKVRDEFEDDLRILFKKYIPKTSDGYIEAMGRGKGFSPII